MIGSGAERVTAFSPLAVKMLIPDSTSFESVTGLPEITALIAVFVLGTIIGSFLNVVIHRVPNELSLLPSSKCPGCNTGIKFYHNIPVLGWLMLRGKCSNCKGSISWRYPAVEMLTGLVFMITYTQIGFSAFLPVALVFVATMIALLFIDAEHMILPNVITYPLFVAAVAVRVAFPVFIDNYAFWDMSFWPLTLMTGYPAWAVSLAGAVLGALVGGGSLWLVGAIWKALRGVDAMGLGDVKMMLGVGALLGWRLALLSIFMGAFAGALVGIVVVIRSKDRDLQTQLPYGIFLGVGSIVAMLAGERLIGWYVATFIP